MSEVTGPTTGPTTVLAFGGNALSPGDAGGSWDEQRGNARAMASVVAGLVKSGHRVVVTHGNGPQAGHLALQQESAANLVAPQPLHAVVAMTQGQLGSLIALSLREQLPSTPVVVIVSHVGVEREDPAFGRPTKPIGPFFDQADARHLARQRGWTIAEVEHGQFRRVVASPAPQLLVELPAVLQSLAAGAVVVAGGGGGIPVVPTGDGGFEPVDGVIDKDLVAERLGSAVGADNLVLLTNVPEVMLDFGTPNQQPIYEMTLAEAMQHSAAGHFATGSMGPKVEAAVSFLKNGGGLAVITSARYAQSALAGQHGTRIVLR
ncbi:MAG TPA: carbamate kinase [Jiangellaceae bacterium]